MFSYDPHPIVMWELTRACDLHCRWCPTGADERHGPNELTTYESYKTIDQIAALRPKELIVTGGDPLEREDVHQIIDYARRRGLDPALVLSPTSQLTSDAVARLARNGLTRVVFSVDGSTPEHAKTLLAIRWAEEAGLQIEINTLVTRRNAGDLENIVDLIRPFSIVRWNVHFVVPVGASKNLEMLTAGEVERVFARIAEIRDREEFSVRVVEAPHYRRHDIRPGARGFVYVSHAGDVRTSEFAPHSAGNLRYRSLGDIYRGSDLFVALRDPANLKGKCGRCDYREICGGSRARAWAMTGDLFASDPLCNYEPAKEATA